MTVDGTGASQEAPRPSPAEMVDRLSRFDGRPEEFLVNLLETQCRLADATGGAILRPGANKAAEVLALYPPPSQGATPPVWLAQAVESAGKAMPTNATVVKPLHSPDELYGQPAQQYLLMIPLRGGPSGQDTRGLAAFFVKASNPASLAVSRERLELTISLLSLYEMRLTLQQRQVSLQRLRTAMETLSVINDQDRFAAAAMAFCNEIASRWQCERVSLGFLKGRYVHLRAMSHTEKFSRKMKLIQDIESAMEECLDQDVEIVHPAENGSSYVSRSAGELSKRHGPTAIVSLPLRKGGGVIGVVTAERSVDEPFSLDQIESLRLVCELCTVRLVNLHEHDKWFGAKAADSLREGIAALVGPKHAWAKLAAVLIFLAILFMVVAKGTYKAEAPFVLEAIQRQVIPAPFEGYLASVAVEPGDAVEADKTILATLETVELEVKLAEVRAEQNRYLTEAAAAMRDDRRAEAQIAQARAKQARAQMELLKYRINQARITSPVSGQVLSGDLKKQIGAPVKTGDVLFEVGTLGKESLRAELSVPEDEIAEVKVGQEGELATASDPGIKVKFVVVRINPVAEVVDQKNVFKVRVRLLETNERMKPGMEGVAKISIDKRSYAWLWTHKITNWIKMKLWL
ncbi:MAG: HlyD family efflux transporter periplasmic adaptor subunit [Actinobacteria bacterium]|nr:HlyD family efflux transporter periplasmic adaptor subunit [Actinomycetota bacterium]